MAKKLLIFSLILISGLIVFTDVIWAKLLSPTNPIANCVRIESSKCIVGEGSASLEWGWNYSSVGGVLKQFKILYREQGSPTWIGIYPDKNSTQYSLLGLVENTDYEWIIKAEAENPADDSDYVNGQPFTTDSAGGGGNGGNGGNGNGWTSPLAISLTNPLAADTFEEAIDAVINILFVLAFAIAPILLIYAGFLLLFRPDDPKERNRARNIIFWVMIALAIIILAKALPAIVKGALSN